MAKQYNRPFVEGSRRLRATAFAAVAVAATGVVTVRGHAAPPAVAVKSCEQLAADRDALKGLGVERDMAKGPAWARANLSETDLKLIKLYIETGERLRFKCTNPAAVAVAAASAVVPSPAAKPDFVPPLPLKRVNAVNAAAGPASPRKPLAKAQPKPKPE